MSELLAHYVGGARIGGGDPAQSLNPSDLSDVVAIAPQAPAELLDAAIDAAAKACQGWAEASPETRADCLDRAGALLLERAGDLGRLLSREEGKTLAEGVAEVARAGRIFRYFAGEAVRRHGQSLDSVRRGVEAQTHREPLGVVGLITPWNFPIAIPAWKSAPALAFGNCVVLKPAALTPAIASALAGVIDEAGFPPGVFNLVFAPGRVAGAMVQDRRVAAISFTGSTTVGSNLAVEAARAGKRVQLEMGGKNPLVILDDADLDRAVEVALDGSYFGSGQRCTASSRLIVTDAIHDRFVAALAERLQALRVGHALDPQTRIGPVASQDQLETICGYVESSRNEGARVVTGGHPVSCATEGYFLAPALIADATADMRAHREEIFGPVATVQRVADYEAALQAANDTEFGLSAGIVTTSLKHAHDFRRRVRAGMVMINLPTAGVDYHLPFGGAKASSMGPREQGFAAVEFYTQTKTSYLAF
ncbi:MAG TPA: aldehyde dehydrogenase family protein [Phenylobacterium sp.]|uniref:aldehyde dehydrogenase family protein n=1 Tax=Phenylobacterium sp. TaxID=1871053 RepID=UPI002B479245|nr:aldehyde dehydrogenase family protein [Phenylobacterium sp.]HKR86915.1 aldehyde dehydrogenase family protein [Phenylobacterium sp.]